MPLWLLLVNVASVSTSIGALIALGMLFLHTRSRGLVLLMGSVACLTADYALGLSLFVSAGSAPGPGLQGFAILADGALIVFGLKGICHVGTLLTAPTAVLSLLDGRSSRAALGTLGAAAAVALAGIGALLGGAIPRATAAVYAVSAAPAYGAYVACFILLIRRRKRVPGPGLARSIVRVATAAIGVFLPRLVAGDAVAIVGARSPAVPIDPIAFFVLTGGTLVCSLLALMESRRRPPAMDIDAFCEAHELSIREREVFLLLGEGLRYKQIGDRLCISLDTVKTHVSTIYRKTSSTGRTDLFYRIRLGRIGLGAP